MNAQLNLSHHRSHHQHGDQTDQSETGHSQKGQSENEAIMAAEKCLREAQVFGGGAVKGVCDTAEAASASAVGLALACAAEAAPLAAAAISTIATGNYLWSTFNPATHSQRNKALETAWHDVWNNTHHHNMNYYEQKVAAQVGHETFDLVLCTAFGTAGFASRGFKPGSTQDNPFTAQSHCHSSKPSNDALGAFRSLQIGGRDSSAMNDFIDGDSHAFEHGRLRLKATHSMRLEGHSRHPMESSQLSDYAISNSR
jgi:hypothetical protein